MMISTEDAYRGLYRMNGYYRFDGFKYYCHKEGYIFKQETIGLLQMLYIIKRKR